MTLKNNPADQATYLDGQTSNARPVHITLDASRLVITADDVSLASWLYDGLYNADEYIKGRPVMFMHHDYPDACLIIQDQSVINTLFARLPRQHHSKAKIQPTFLMMTALTVACGAMIWLSWSAVMHLGVLAKFIPAFWEKPIGEALVPELTEAREYAHNFPCRADIQQRHLQKIIGTLAHKNDMPEPLEVLVSPTSEINAYALPGNVILVNQGFLDFVKDDQEIAGVLAHEIGHLARHHVMEGLIQSVGLQVVIKAMAGGSESLGRIGSAGAQAFALSYSRAHEKEADQSARDYLSASGLSTSGLINFFIRVEKFYGIPKGLTDNEFVSYFSSHPMLKERTATLAQNPPVPTGMAILTSTEFVALKTAGKLTCPKTP